MNLDLATELAKAKIDAFMNDTSKICPKCGKKQLIKANVVTYLIDIDAEETDYEPEIKIEYHCKRCSHFTMMI